VATSVSPRRQHAKKFGLIYLVLIVGGGIAAALSVKVALDGRPPTPPPWSAFKPSATDTKAVAQIANYVQGEYLQANGKSLTEVRGGPLVMGSQPVQLAVRPDAVSTTVDSVSGVTAEYNMCGNASSCSVPKGVSPQRAGVLTRREAYQLAMLTFKYVPTVDNVVVLMPPLVKNTKARAIFIRRTDVQSDLGARTLTLPGQASKISQVTQREAEMIAKRTDPFVYSWILANVGSTPTLVVNPINLDVKDSIPAASSG
jgi:hypothetical protein